MITLTSICEIFGVNVNCRKKYQHHGGGPGLLNEYESHQEMLAHEQMKKSEPKHKYSYTECPKYRDPEEERKIWCYDENFKLVKISPKELGWE